MGRENPGLKELEGGIEQQAGTDDIEIEPKKHMSAHTKMIHIHMREEREERFFTERYEEAQRQAGGSARKAHMVLQNLPATKTHV